MLRHGRSRSAAAGRLAALALALGAAAAPLDAQRLPAHPWRPAPTALAANSPFAPASVAVGRAAAAPAALPPVAAAARSPRSPRVAPYLAGGAALGAAVAGLRVALQLRRQRCDECMVFPHVVALDVGKGAAVGAGVGGLVYLVRRALWAPPAPR